MSKVVKTFWLKAMPWTYFYDDFLRPQKIKNWRY